ncbi:MAG: hypothetical protein ACPGOY_03885 [Rhodospirillaceae bacterium]
MVRFITQASTTKTPHGFILSGFMGIALFAGLSPAPAVAQTFATIQPHVSGTEDLSNTATGTEVQIVCRATDILGNTVRLRGSPILGGPQPRLVLEIDHQPRNGFDGAITGAKAQGTLTRNGHYTFRCRVQGGPLLTPTRNKTTTIVARTPSIAGIRNTLTSVRTGQEQAAFEVNEVIQIQMRAYERANRVGALIRPSTTQLVLRQGRVGCYQGGTNASPQFRNRQSEAWTAEDGVIKRITPTRAGTYTAIMVQSAGQGTANCEAKTFRVVADHYPPTAEITTPNRDHQMVWNRRLLPIRGTAFDSGSGIRTVRVSNGHWSENARLLPGENPGEVRFFADLPSVAGLQILQVTAIDRDGKEGRAMESLYVGRRFLGLKTRADQQLFMGRDEVRLMLGRDFIRNQEPGIDSVDEILKVAPELLSENNLFSGLDPVDISEDIDSSIGDGIGNLFVPDFEVRGSITPGEISLSAFSRNDRIDLHVTVPIGGRATMKCDGIFWEPLLCLTQGVFTGRFSVNISGDVTAIIPVSTSVTGGWHLLLHQSDIRMQQSLRVRNGLDNNGEINSQFRTKIVEEVESTIRSALLELAGCGERDPITGLTCNPERPFLTSPQNPQAEPDAVGLYLNDGERVMDFEYDTPSLTDAEAPKLVFDLLLNEFRQKNGDFHIQVSPNAKHIDGQIPPGVYGYLIEEGTFTDQRVPRVQTPNIRRWFGAGLQDNALLVHHSYINEFLAHYWLAGGMRIERPLFDVLEDAGQLPEDRTALLGARNAMQNAKLIVDLGAPPRVTNYDGAPDLYGEVGDIKIIIDFSEDFESQLIFEAALVTKLSLGVTEDRDGFQIDLTNPLGCVPSQRRQMNCGGRFELSLKEVVGFGPNSPRLPLFRAEEYWIQLLDSLNLTTEDGTPLPATETEDKYKESFGAAIASFLNEPVTFPIPALPVEAFANEELPLDNLGVEDLRFHRQANGSGLADGWIGLSFALGIKEEEDEE